MSASAAQSVVAGLLEQHPHLALELGDPGAQLGDLVAHALQYARGQRADALDPLTQARVRVAERLVALEDHVKELVVGRVAHVRVLEERVGDEVGGAELTRDQVLATGKQALEEVEAGSPSRRRARRPRPPSGSSLSSSASIAFGAAL